VLLADNQFLLDMGIKGQPVRMGLLMSLFLLAYGVGNLVLAPIGDYIGPRKAMLIAVVAWILSVMIGGFATLFVTVLVARVILGLGEGLHWPMQSKFMKNWIPPGERGKGNAIWMIGAIAGPAVAIQFFTFVIGSWGGRPSFFVLAALGLIPLALLWFVVTDHPRQNKRVNKEELNYIEEALNEEAKKESSMLTDTLGQRIKSFVFNYRFWLLTINYFAVVGVWWGTLAWLPSYLKVARGFSWASMGLWATFPYAVAPIVSFILSHLSDKLGRRVPFMVFMHAAGALGLYLGAHTTDNITAVLLISISISASASCSTLSWSLLQSLVPSKATGSAAGAMSGIGNFFSALTPVAIGFFISLAGGYIGGLMFLVGVAALGAIAMTPLLWQKL
jgi:sugar phosphate permease